MDFVVAAIAMNRFFETDFPFVHFSLTGGTPRLALQWFRCVSLVLFIHGVRRLNLVR
jgi:hypothetical protein